MPVGWAILGGAAIGAVGSMGAANTQAGAQEKAAQTQWNMFNTINSQEQPFIQGGYGALNELLYGLGIGGGGGYTPSPATPGGPGVGSSQYGPNGPIGVMPGGQPNYGAPGGGFMPTPGGGVKQILPGGTAGGMVSGGGQIAGGGHGPTATGAGMPGGAPGSGLGFGQLTSNFTPQDFLNNLDPGYGFQLRTGAQALRNADTPGMGALSGAALKDLMGFNQGMAATGYQNAYNRWNTTNQNIFSRLSGIAGLGQNAATQVGTSGTQLGTGIAQAQAAAGGSLAGGIVGATNSVGSSLPLSYLMANGYGQGSTTAQTYQAPDVSQIGSAWSSGGGS